MGVRSVRKPGSKKKKGAKVSHATHSAVKKKGHVAAGHHAVHHAAKKHA